jgi:hypothetical protein
LYLPYLFPPFGAIFRDPAVRGTCCKIARDLSMLSYSHNDTKWLRCNNLFCHNSIFVHTCQTSWRYAPGNHNIHTDCCENLKYHILRDWPSNSTEHSPSWVTFICWVSQEIGRTVAQRLEAGFPPRRPGFSYGQHVGFLVDKAALGQVFPSTSVSTANHSTNFSIITITRGWYNRPLSGNLQI